MIVVARPVMVVMMIGRFLKIDHKDTLWYADLDRRKADTGGIIHGVEHVFDQLLKLVVKLRHRI
jgi:hypothetical protein